MRSPWKILLLAALVVFAGDVRAEEDVELALEPPDEPGSESQLREKAEEQEREAASAAEEGDPSASVEPPEDAGLESADGETVVQRPESEVPQIDDNAYESRVGTEQMRLLKFHQQIIVDRER